MLCFGLDLLTVVCADVFCIPDIYVIYCSNFLFLFGTGFDGLISFWFPATYGK